MGISVFSVVFSEEESPQDKNPRENNTMPQ
jgi:hypothetical protein